MTVYKINPVAKPRMTQSDKWKKRPAVLKYRAFKDEVRLKMKNTELHEKCIIFRVPMPTSWSKKKRQEMDGQYHRQTPDLDNMIKALADALYTQDSVIACFRAAKYWAQDGAIEVRPITAVGLTASQE